MMTIENKIVLITGASSGIGRELARQLAEKNNQLILIARRRQRLEELLTKLPTPDAQRQHLIYRCDVSDEQQVKSSCDDLIEKKLIPHVLILNAGVGSSYNINHMDLNAFKATFDVNFWGVLYFIDYFYPYFRHRNEPSMIAATASLAGYRGMPGSAPYSSSKAALINLMESLYIDLFKINIQITTISPGFVKSEMTDNNAFYMPFFMSTDKAVRCIVKGLEKGKAEIHFPYRLSVAAKLSRFLPLRWYAKLMYNKR